MVDFQQYRSVSFQEMLKTGGGAAGGLTVRDYFAGLAMQGGLHADVIEALQDESLDGYFEAYATFAYRIADAMMAERNRPLQKPTPTAEEAFGLDK